MECIETCCAKKSLGLSHVWRKGSRYRSGFLAGLGWLMGFHIHPKSNIDTQNDGILDVSPVKHGYFGYLC